MSDACGCSDDETTPGGEEAEEHEAERLWEVSEALVSSSGRPRRGR